MWSTQDGKDLSGLIEDVWAQQGTTAETPRRTLRMTIGAREAAIEIVRLPTGIPGVTGATAVKTIAIVRDVTDGKATLARIEGALAQWSGFIHSAPMLSFVKDEQLRYAYVNPAYEKYFGMQSGSILGKQDQDFRPSEMAQRLRENDQIVLSTGHPLQSIDQVPGPKGGTDSFLAVKFRFTDADGRKFVCGCGINITAQVKAEENAVRLNAALREQMAENKLLLETLPVGIAVARDPSCDVIEANPLLASMLGIETKNNVSLIRSDQALSIGVAGGPRFQMMRHGEPVPPEQLPMNVACSTGKGVEKFEATAIRADGTAVEIVGSAAPLLNADGSVRGAVGAFLDVSEQKRLQAALLQAAKMESIGRLAGGVAHDFNNLLTAVTGFADLIEESLPTDSGAASADQSREHLRALKMAAEQATSLTRQLLAFARKQPFSTSVVSIDDLVREQEPMIRRLVGERVRVKMDLGSRGAMVKADAVQVQQVLMSLAANARDAIMQMGANAGQGDLVITSTEVTLHERDPECVEREGVARRAGAGAGHADSTGSGLTPGRYVRVDVRDTGHGISAENRVRLFEPFFTTKPRGRGTGLGLATAYGIMKQHGGTISVTSEIGAGAAFHLYFPVTAQPAGESTGVPVEPKGTARTTEGTAGAASGGRETILLVEDEPLVMDAAARMLASLGYRVIQANSGAAALAASRQHAGEISLVLSDVMMPEMNGPELAVRLLEMRPRTRVLFMSGYPNDVHWRQSPTKQFRGELLLKPFTIEDLGKRVRSVLSRGSATATASAGASSER